MKRVMGIVLSLGLSAPALAFEQAMHLYLALEAFQHVRIGSEFYKHPAAKEFEAAVALLETYGASLSSPCRGPLAAECDVLKRRIARLQMEMKPLPSLQGKPVSIFYPSVGKVPPYDVAKDGIMVSAPFRASLEALGIEEFLRNFLAGVLGPDSFPDFLSGGMAAHVDLSNAPLSIKNMLGIDIPVDTPELKLWKSWQWGAYVFKAAHDRALFDRIAAEWGETRPYWGKTYKRAELAARLQHEAIAFAYGYWVHMAEDAVAHEMVSSFNGGAFWFPNWLTPNKLVENRHSAVEGYMLAKAKPFIWRYATTLVDIKAPIPFLREVLTKGRGLTQAPLAVHLLLLSKLDALTGLIFKCPSPTFTRTRCGGKEPPAVYSALDCATKANGCEQSDCLLGVVCQFAKNVYADHRELHRDATDAWLLLSLAIARMYGADAFHPRIQEALAAKGQWPTLTGRYRSALKQYGFAEAFDAGFAGGSQTRTADYTGEAVRLYAEQFLIPSLVPVRVSYDANHQPKPLALAPAFERQMSFDCAYMGYTNTVAICELVKSVVVRAATRLFEGVQALVAKLQTLFADAALVQNFEQRKRPSRLQALAVAAGREVSARAVAEKPEYNAPPDVRMNAMYPCAKGQKCADDGATGPVAENAISRELKRRLERFVGLDAAKGLLSRDWSSCFGANGRRAPTGERRTLCFNDSVFRGLLSGTLADRHSPPHASPWLRRALTMTFVAMTSDGSLSELANGVKEFPTRAACERTMTTFEQGARNHLLIGVQASLVGVNRLATPKLVNGYFDELAYGKFALYDAACEPLRKAILPDVPDTDGDGVNDIYDTCPDTKCEAGWVPDPTGDHVGGNCGQRAARPFTRDYCIVRDTVR
ncbi:MAG: hypothetical protein HYY84_08815 [Deltaproteobacteria bacterium]|nr:hypothetical protein [Deltaproteobacteria bacterium]